MSAYWRQYFHLVWATKDREPFITPDVEPHLYSYIVRKSSELGVYVYAINGMPDHTHLVAAIPPKYGTAKVVQRLKGASSYFVTHNLNKELVWQRGYGSLTMGELKLPIAIAYVDKQKIHHDKSSTNHWLEYSTALDEGPPDKGLESGVDRIFREEPADYNAWGPPLF